MTSVIVFLCLPKNALYLQQTVVPHKLDKIRCLTLPGYTIIPVKANRYES